jgi:hypothetical protein
MNLFDSVLHFFIPRHTNNHRARILHPTFLTYIIIGLVSLQIVFPFVRHMSPAILGFATNISVEKLLEDTNNERLKQGLGPLTLNTTLSTAAHKKAEDMFVHDYWAHVSPDGTTPWDFIIGEGYRYTYAGENLARDFNDSDGVVQAWMNSPSHKDNLLRPEYEEIGFAVVNGNLNGSDTTLVVQMFGTKRPGYVARETAPKIPEPSQAIASVSPTIPEPSPTVIFTTPTSAPVAAVVENPVQGTIEKPLVNQKALERTISISIATVFLFILVLDGLFIWKHKIIRIAGHNLAHFIFLAALLGIIILGTSGAIL